MSPDAGWTWAVTQGSLGVACFVLFWMLVYAVRYINKLIDQRDLLYRENIALIVANRDALNESTRAIEKLTEGLVAIRGSVVDLIQMYINGKALLDDVGREVKATKALLDEAAREIKSLSHPRGRGS